VISASQSTVGLPLTMADHVTVVCRTGYFWLRQLRSVVQSLTSEAADSLIQLLQCLAVWHCRSPTAATAISPEHSCASGDWNPAHRPHYTGSPVTSLAAGATTRHFQVGDTGSQVLERPSTCDLAIWPTTSVLPAAIVLAHCQPPA